MKNTFVRAGFIIATAVWAGCGDAAPAASQDVHPDKVAFANVGEWPTVSVGAAGLANFEPFRAVYERIYRNGAGEERRDRVIVTAERVAWNDTPAISVSLLDAGNSEYDDTAMRSQTRVFSEADHSMLLFIAPVPGTPRDYMVAHTDGSARITVVEAATGTGTLQPGSFPLPQLGAPGLWLIGSMSLEANQRIAFANADAPAPSNILGARPVVVTARESVDAGPLGSQQAWIVSYPLGMTNGRFMQNLVIDRPPYLLGKRPLDVDSGESSEVGTLRLVEFTAFSGGD